MLVSFTLWCFKVFYEEMHQIKKVCSFKQIFKFSCLPSVFSVFPAGMMSSVLLFDKLVFLLWRKPYSLQQLETKKRTWASPGRTCGDVLLTDCSPAENFTRLELEKPEMHFSFLDDFTSRAHLKAKNLVAQAPKVPLSLIQFKNFLQHKLFSFVGHHAELISPQQQFTHHWQLQHLALEYQL